MALSNSNILFFLRDFRNPFDGGHLSNPKTEFWWSLSFAFQKGHPLPSDLIERPRVNAKRDSLHLPVLGVFAP